MTVLQIGEDKLKITLSDIEVLGCFGDYERLYSMNNSIKTILKALLREIIADYGFKNKNPKIIAEIKAKKHSGCEITLSSVQNCKRPHIKTVFEFRDFEEVIGGVLRLFRGPYNSTLKSSLYKLDNKFRLIINSNRTPEDFFIMNEFCRIINSPTAAAYTEEYGKPLIKTRAIQTLGNLFALP